MDPGSSPGGAPQLSYPSGQQFCVSWHSYQSNMHSAFPKLLSSEQFVDVTLACDKGSIKCHKVVLSACSDYLERLLLDLPCTHPIIFLRDMKMWELQALVEFMYRGEVYVEQQQLANLMQAAEALQVRGLSNGKSQIDNSNHVGPNGATSTTPINNSATPVKPSTPKFQQTSSVPSCGASSTGGASSGSGVGADLSQCDDAQSNEDGGSESDFLTSSGLVASLPASITATPTHQHHDNHLPNPLNAGNFHLDQLEIQHELEKALSSSFESTLTETQGMVKMEPDEHHQQLMQQHQEKPYTISPMNMGNCAPGSPFPAEGYTRRQRRSEAELKKAAEMVAGGNTFQVASERYNIPISTIRFYMARKGILQRRKRGRGACHGGNSQPSSPASPPYHMINFPHA